TGLNFLCAFRNYFEKERIDVVGTGKQNIFLWTTLATFANKFVSVLEIIVSGKRLSNVIAWIEWRTIECFDESNPVFVDNCCIEQSHHKQPGFCLAGSLNRSGLSQYAIHTRCQNIDLWSLLTS